MIDENDDDYTVDCPNCGEPIYEDVPQCPYCGHYVTSADFGHRFPKWVVIIIRANDSDVLASGIGRNLEFPYGK